MTEQERLVAEAAAADPGELEEPPLCVCEHGYRGHSGNPSHEEEWIGIADWWAWRQAWIPDGE